MRKYYIHHSNKQSGPYTYEEVKELGIYAHTLIRIEDTNDECEAQFLKEFKCFFNHNPLAEEVKGNIPNLLPINKPMHNTKIVTIDDAMRKKAKKIMFPIVALVALLLLVALIAGYQYQKQANKQKQSNGLNQKQVRRLPMP